MARIRIVDEWLRSPVSLPSRHRAIMVVTDSWAEQRVLMRAFASSSDQTRPTIELHGTQLAIGPASTDPHGTWGIHVEPPIDGRAQELRTELETAARRLAGSKGNPPRLRDEASSFERKRTPYWAPGTPRDLPAGARQQVVPPQRNVVSPRRTPVPGYYEPAVVAPPVRAPKMPAAAGKKSVGRRRKRGWTSPVPTVPAAEVGVPNKRSVGATTAIGYSGGPVLPPRRRPAKANRPVAKLANRTLPPGLALEDAERRVLNALAEVASLTAARIGEIAGVEDGAAWMDSLSQRLGQHGVDLVRQGPPEDGHTTYLLRR